MLFILLPIMLKAKISFFLSLTLATLAMFACYGGMLWLLHHFGIRL